MTDLTDESSRAQGMGVIGAASGIGLVLGTALGGSLGSIDPTLPFYATAAVAAAELRARGVRAARVEGRRCPRSSGWRGSRACSIPAPLLVVASVHGRKQRLYLFLFLHIFFAFSAIESMFPLFARCALRLGRDADGPVHGRDRARAGRESGADRRAGSRALWGERMMTTVGLGAHRRIDRGALGRVTRSRPSRLCAIGVALGGGHRLPRLHEPVLQGVRRARGGRGHVAQPGDDPPGPRARRARAGAGCSRRAGAGRAVLLRRPRAVGRARRCSSHPPRVLLPQP